MPDHALFRASRPAAASRPAIRFHEMPSANRSAGDRDDRRWLVQERPHGAYLRQFTIGNDVDAEGINASYDGGVLSVVIPIAERAKPRKITVESASDPARKSVTA